MSPQKYVESISDNVNCRAIYGISIAALLKHDLYASIDRQKV